MTPADPLSPRRAAGLLVSSTAWNASAIARSHPGRLTHRQFGDRDPDATDAVLPADVVFCKRYVTGAGIGTLLSLMIPYSIGLAVLWTAFLLAMWALDIPLGIGSSYEYVPAG